MLCDDLSRARVQSLIEGGAVKLNGSICTSSKEKIAEGDVIKILMPPLEDAVPRPEDIPLDIVYEDDDLLVINKPVGMTVHPGAGQHDGTLVNALLHHCAGGLSGIGGVARPGIVHRLDKDTSGLMVVAKHDKAHKGLSDQLEDRTLGRIYTAFVWKVPMPIKGIIDQPIGRHKTSRTKMSVRGASSREATTHYHMEQAYGTTAAKVICQLETGRTHQIRVHMAHIRHPLIGDTTYGLPAQEARSLLNRGGLEPEAREAVMALGRQALHASEIHFIHPVSGEEMAFEAPLPDDLLALESILETIG
jgi:23S rRNA pseudouridine1911/1915/1917 synthase